MLEVLRYTAQCYYHHSHSIIPVTAYSFHLIKTAHAAMFLISNDCTSSDNQFVITYTITHSDLHLMIFVSQSSKSHYYNYISE